ncbi:protein phosphatase 2C domain-containing protein [Chloroflexota bacterium]
MAEALCPNCGYQNRANARFCKKCGQPIGQTDESVPVAGPRQAPPASGEGNFFDEMLDELGYLAEDVKGAFNSLSNALLGKRSGWKSQQRPPQAASQATPAKHSQSGANAPTKLISDSLAPKAIGEHIGGYVILATWPLQRTNYYQVRQTHCPQGHANPDNIECCNTCQTELPIYLIRASRLQGIAADNESRQILIKLSQVDPTAILKHISIFDDGQGRFVVVQYPGDGWQSISQLPLPVLQQHLLVEWGLSLGGALLKLYENGFIPRMATLSDILEPIILTNQRQAFFADLTAFSRVEPPPSPDQAQDHHFTQQQKMIVYLSQLLYILASGRPQSLQLAPRDFSDMPPPFRGLVSRASQAEFQTLDAFLQALQGALKVPESTRSLQQISGYRTDVGKKRHHNEDFVGKYSLGMQQTADTPEVGLYLVADGMGGHQAGELASKDVVRVIVDEIQDKVQELQAAPKLKRSTIRLGQVITTADVLKAAIQRSNQVLLKSRHEIGSDRGTTITAALIIGETCAIANVGDSRTYLLRNNSFEQITVDHSLVASLVAANMIQPDEVRSHPQRSHIFRTLGEREEVEIDVFELALQAGDRLLLCSDGLWEMVLDLEIHKFLIESNTPQQVCDALIDAANLAGGEDNISVVTVWLA